MLEGAAVGSRGRPTGCGPLWEIVFGPLAWGVPRVVFCGVTVEMLEKVWRVFLVIILSGLAVVGVCLSQPAAIGFFSPGGAG